MSAPARILVVEDELIIARGIEKRLKAFGYAVAGLASTGEEAVRKAAEVTPDLILMDIRLGNGIDGIDAAGQIRGRLDVPVVYLTAYSDGVTLQRAKLTDPFGYVLKPYEDKDLQIAIEIGLHKHRMERRARENEEWLAATLACIGDGVIATDARGRVRFMNSLAEELTGWALAGARGRDVAEVFRIVERATRRPVANPALDALAKGRPATLPPGTVLIDRAGAERPIDDCATPIRDLAGAVSGAVMVFRDVTERLRLEEHLRQSQKLEAIGRLAGGIAHDFNNVMTVITGYSELLLSDSAPAAEGREALRHIQAAAKSAAALTRQILAFSRKQVLVPCVLNLNAVLRDTGGMVQRLIGSNIQFVTEPAPDLGQVKADPTQVGQVILNLAVNAREAMADGGRLVVATANAELGAEAALRDPEVRPGRYVLLSVSDTGCGMSEEVLAHVFEPFFTTKGGGRGTGLGLATVHGIVKQSGGHVEVTSRPGAGTTFRVYLPRVEEPPEPPPADREPRPAGQGVETVLVVEDEETVRQMTARILRQQGYAVLEAPDGLAAVEVVKGHPGPIHLLLTDLVMPHLSGREVAERLTALKPGLRVLFMSGYAGDLLGQQGVESAGADFLPKPFRIADLTAKVREVLDR